MPEGKGESTPSAQATEGDKPNLLCPPPASAHPPSTRERLWKIVREDPGITLGELGKALGVSRQRAHQILLSGREGPLERPVQPQKVPHEEIVERFEFLRDVDAVCLEMHLSPSHVRRVLTKAGIEFGKRGRASQSASTAALIVRVRCGDLVRDAAAALGMTCIAARNRLRRAHVGVKPDPPPPGEEVVARYQAGASLPELAAYYGTDRKQISRWVHAAGGETRPKGRTLAIRNQRRIHMLPNTSRGIGNDILDDPAQLYALVPAEARGELLVEATPELFDDEENLPPHLQKMRE